MMEKEEITCKCKHPDLHPMFGTEDSQGLTDVIFLKCENCKRLYYGVI